MKIFLFFDLSFSLKIPFFSQMSKNVHFQTKATIYTIYSSLEYDRSHCLSQTSSRSTSCATPLPQRSAVNVNHFRRPNQPRPFIKPLDLSLIPNSSRRSLDSSLNDFVSEADSRPFLSKGHRQAQQEHDGLDDISMIIMAF